MTSTCKACHMFRTKCIMHFLRSSSVCVLLPIDIFLDALVSNSILTVLLHTVSPIKKYIDIYSIYRPALVTGIFHSKIYILSLITHPQVVPNLQDLCSSWSYDRSILKCTSLGPDILQTKFVFVLRLGAKRSSKRLSNGILFSNIPRAAGGGV